MYYPTPVEYIRIQQIPHQPLEIKIKSTDGVQLNAWQFHAPPDGSKRNKPKAVILQFHGNGQNLTTHFSLLYPLVENGYDLIAFDYRGYGKSTGEPNPKGLVEDGVAMIRWVSANYPETPIVIFAHSLGGAVAMKSLIELKQVVPIQLLILDSTFSSYRSAARRVASHSWVTWPLQPIAWLIIDNSQAPKGSLGELGPYKKIVVHGTADQVVDFDLGRDVFNELTEPKEFWSIQNGQHIDFMWRENGRYAEKIKIELEKLK